MTKDMSRASLRGRGYAGRKSGRDFVPPLPTLPALVRHHRRFLGGGLRPDRDVVLAVLQLDDDARGEDVLALVVELDALVADHELIGLEVGRLQRRLDLG